MSAAIRQIPTPANVDAAWERYAELARAYRDNPALAADRAHCEALVRAFQEWKDLFLAAEWPR